MTNCSMPGEHSVMSGSSLRPHLQRRVASLQPPTSLHCLRAMVLSGVTDACADD
jgi:hypothetical protein